MVQSPPIEVHFVVMCKAWSENVFSQMGPVRIRHSSHDFGWQSSHSVDLAGWQAKLASIEIWIPWRHGYKPHLGQSLVCGLYVKLLAALLESLTTGRVWVRFLSVHCTKYLDIYPGNKTGKFSWHISTNSREHPICPHRPHEGCSAPQQ